MNNQGRILSCDIYENKMSKISNLAQRLGISIIDTMVHDATKLLNSEKGKADRVICDVPCSGIGVIRRKPEIKYKRDLDLDELIERQKMILEKASEYVKKGGVLCYSTCTVNPDENEKQVMKFLENNKGFKIEREEKLTPMGGTDGFYICKLIREV